MKKLMLLVAACLPLSAVLLAPSAGAATHPPAPDTSPKCSGLHISAPPGARLESVTATANPGGTFTFPASVLAQETTITNVPAFCDVVVTVTHPGARDHVKIKVELPQDRVHWNGRFQATGGSGYQAGDFGYSLVAAVKSGYSASATDAGVAQTPFGAVDVSGWALNKNGTVNVGLLQDFASRSVHDMAVVGKSVVRAFYGNSARYSYWNGCSTGGRQGYVEAQDYPQDFQGILANAPAVNWDRFAVATEWAQVVFNEEHTRPTSCELEAFNDAAVKACDTIDGVQDGIIDNPQECQWDPRRLIGTKILCDGETLTITAADAEVVRRIWDGPVDPNGRQLWYGPNKGARFDYLANAAQPFPISDQWLKYFVARNPGLNTNTLTDKQFTQLFRQSERAYHDVIGSDTPNLKAFAKAGGKLLSWQGQADQLVPTQGTADYRDRVDAVMGGDQNVDKFYRLFLLPGVAHCGAGNGPQPTDDLGQLVAWVEHGQAPDTLATSVVRADGSTATRNVCPFPQVTQYRGTGDPNSAANYSCNN